MKRAWLWVVKAQLPIDRADRTVVIRTLALVVSVRKSRWDAMFIESTSPLISGAIYGRQMLGC
jgi:hypothetical protein